MKYWSLCAYDIISKHGCLTSPNIVVSGLGKNGNPSPPSSIISFSTEELLQPPTAGPDRATPPLLPDHRESNRRLERPGTTAVTFVNAIKLE